MKRAEKLKWYAKEFENIHEDIKSKEHLSYHDFLRIRNFKLQNSTIENEDNIKIITSRAFKLAKEDNIKESIQLLQEKLDGVGIPIASTILAMKFPNKYAIIDRRVIESLGKKEWLTDYLINPDTYEKYLSLIREKAGKEGKRLRNCERELFERSIIK
nr:hypothetical protein [Nanoarchaeum sp.]